MLNARGELSDVVLIDLGLALPFSIAPGGKSPISLLPYVEPFGVRGYRAPEVQRRQSYGPAVDVFALGRVMYNMLRRFARAPTEPLTMAALVGWVHPGSAWAYEALYCTPPISFRWPVALREIMLRCLAADPSRRPSCAELTARLARLVPDYVDSVGGPSSGP